MELLEETKNYCKKMLLKQELIQRGAIDLAKEVIREVASFTLLDGIVLNIKTVDQIKDLTGKLNDIMFIINLSDTDIEWAKKKLDELKTSTKGGLDE